MQKLRHKKKLFKLQFCLQNKQFNKGLSEIDEKEKNPINKINLYFF